jgi:DNA primase
MAHIPEEIIDEIRRRADIVDLIGATVPLQRRGSDYWACCPFHQEKTPSFKVDQQRQTY